MPPFTRILAAVNFSLNCRAALAEAARLAELHSAPLHVLHVADPLAIEELGEAIGGEGVEDVLLRELQDKLAAELHAAAPGARAADVRVVTGAPLAEILKASATEPRGALVLGRNDATDPDRGPGGVALACVRKNAGATLLVARDRRGPYRRVLAAVDFSDNAALALARAVELAHADDADLDIVHAFAPPWERLRYRAPTPEASVRFRVQYRAALEAHLESFTRDARATRGTLRVKTTLLEAVSPGVAVADHANAAGADLVVVGARGLSAVKTLLLGSVAERILRDTRCSALALKPADFRYALV